MRTLKNIVKRSQTSQPRELSKQEHETIYKLMAVTGYAILLIGDLKNTSIYSQKLKNTASRFLNELESFEDKIVGINVPDNDIEQSHEQMLDSYEVAENLFNAVFTVKEANHEQFNSYLLKGVEYYKSGGHTLLTTDILESYGFEKEEESDSFILQTSSIDSLMLVLRADGFFYPDIIQDGTRFSVYNNVVSLNKIKYTIELKNIYTVMTGKELKLKEDR